MKIKNIKALGYAKGQLLAYELAAEYYPDIGDIEANWQTFKDAVLEGMDLARRDGYYRGGYDDQTQNP